MKSLLRQKRIDHLLSLHSGGLLTSPTLAPTTSAAATATASNISVGSSGRVPIHELLHVKLALAALHTNKKNVERKTNVLFLPVCSI